MAPKFTSESLANEKRRIFLKGRGGVSLPAAGALYWTGLGVAGFFLPDYVWCLTALFTSGLIFPLGIFLSKPLGANLFLVSPLADIWFPAFTPVFLSFAITVPAFYVDVSLVPLTLAVGMSLHWPVFGWLYNQPVFLIHAVVRVFAVTAIWLLFPAVRFTVLPLVVGLVYLVTFVWLLNRVKVAELHAK